MKKLILIIAITVLTAINVNSQTQFGVKTGLNIANLSGDLEGADSRLGLNFGVFAEILISEKLIFQPELLYSMQGAKSDYSGEAYSNKVKFKYNYLNVPLIIKYYVVNNFAVEVGPQIGFLLSAKDDYTFNYGGEPTNEEYDSKNDLKSIDFGLNFGVSYTISKKISFGARYNVGLYNIDDATHYNVMPQIDEIAEDNGEYDFEIKNSVFLFSVGYLFN
ncbi:porin family protein [Lutibacter sp. TH_r2]|uniref:porin family protein n=1 Tax=Lutibacter sp. TH_r2 TaxID=3082083 RepID=UPI00295525BE|nr:porin family protein [Lutibacter sp. TH_r2]MDV7187482.1 porin family protein [Lutibacter sp. TH_r2]